MVYFALWDLWDVGSLDHSAILCPVDQGQLPCWFAMLTKGSQEGIAHLDQATSYM